MRVRVGGQRNVVKEQIEKGGGENGALWNSVLKV